MLIIWRRRSVWHLATDATGQDRVAYEGVVRDDQANAARRVPGGVDDRHLEVAELELVAVDEITVGRAQELFGVSRVDCGLTAHQGLQVVLAADMARMAMGGHDPADRRAGQLLGDLLR